MLSVGVVVSKYHGANVPVALAQNTSVSTPCPDQHGPGPTGHILAAGLGCFMREKLKFSMFNIELLRPQGPHRPEREDGHVWGDPHLCARDGFSGKVVAFVSMPIKNNVEIYNHLFRLFHLFVA